MLRKVWNVNTRVVCVTVGDIGTMPEDTGWIGNSRRGWNYGTAGDLEDTKKDVSRMTTEASNVKKSYSNSALFFI